MDCVKVCKKYVFVINFIQFFTKHKEHSLHKSIVFIIQLKLQLSKKFQNLNKIITVAYRKIGDLKLLF